MNILFTGIFIKMYIAKLSKLPASLHAYHILKLFPPLSSFQRQNVQACVSYFSDRNVQIKRVYENTTAIIPCANLKKDEELVSASLYKGKTELHSADMSNNRQESCEKFKVSQQNYSVSYMIYSTESNDTGIYICKIQTRIGQTETSKENNTILLVKGMTNVTSSQLLHVNLHISIILMNFKYAFKYASLHSCCFLISDAQQSTEPSEPSDPCSLTLTVIYSLWGVAILFDLIITVIVCVLVVSINICDCMLAHIFHITGTHPL